MYYGHLNGHEEYVFKQSSMGGLYHIAVDGTEFEETLASGKLGQIELRIDTWCGRNYKYGDYSIMTKKDGGVRNACEYCFVEYEPEDKVERRHEASRRRQVPTGDLPF